MSANKDHCLHLLLQSYAAWFSAAAAVPSVLQSASVGPSGEKWRGERCFGRAARTTHATRCSRENTGLQVAGLGVKA